MKFSACLFVVAISAATHVALHAGEQVIGGGGLLWWDADRDALVVGSRTGMGDHQNVDGGLELIGPTGRDTRLTVAHFGNSRPIVQLTNARGTQAYPLAAYEYGQILGDIIWDGWVPNEVLPPDRSQAAGGLFLGATRLRSIARTTTHDPVNGIPASLQVQLSSTGTTFARALEVWDWQNTPSGWTNLEVGYRISFRETAMSRIGIGEPDSCGAGYRCLRVPNQ